MRVRWRVGKNEYVETYEHRITNGRVTTATHVHHKNLQRNDNTPDNLKGYETEAKHQKEHRRIDRTRAVELYNSGSKLKDIASELGANVGTLSRILREEGVTMRTNGTYKKIEIDEHMLRSLCQSPGARVGWMADILGVSSGVVRTRMREYGIPPFPVGNPPKSLHP